MLFLLVGADCNQEDCILALPKIKIEITYILVSLYDVIVVLMTHDEYDYAIKNIMLDIL